MEFPALARVEGPPIIHLIVDFVNRHYAQKEGHFAPQLLLITSIAWSAMSCNSAILSPT
jgi:hypothetical protein